MHWGDKKREISPEEVKKLPSDVEVHLEGRDRYGESTWIEGHVVSSGKKKVFMYYAGFERETKPIKAYPNKRWMIQG